MRGSIKEVHQKNNSSEEAGKAARCTWEFGGASQRKQHYSEALNNEFHPRVEHRPWHRIAHKAMVATWISGIYLPWARLGENRHLREIQEEGMSLYVMFSWTL